VSLGLTRITRPLSSAGPGRLGGGKEKEEERGEGSREGYRGAQRASGCLGWETASPETALNLRQSLQPLYMGTLGLFTRWRGSRSYGGYTERERRRGREGSYGGAIEVFEEWRVAGRPLCDPSSYTLYITLVPRQDHSIFRT
jgi:hypothetical protein